MADPRQSGAARSPRHVDRDVDVAIVGAGASATFLLHHLRRGPGRAPTVALVAPDPRPGPGVPYRTPDPAHRMNVRACQVSADPEEPDGFAAWARSHGHDTSSQTYVARGLYGDYLADVFARATAGLPVFDRYHDEVVALSPTVSGRTILRGASGTTLSAGHVILAVGTPGRSGTRCRVDPDVEAAGRFVADPLAPGALDGIGRCRRAVLVGTGLTAVDVALTLARSPRRVLLTAVSPSGQLPRRHEEVRRTLSQPLPPVPTDLTAHRLVGWVRTAVAAEPNGWQPVVDAIRYELGSLWPRLSPEDQERVVRRCGALWSRHRHRMAPAVADEVDALLASGGLQILAGRVVGVRRRATGGVTVEATGVGDLDADVVLDCSGPPRPGESASPLLRQLLGDGVLSPDHLGLGVRVDAAGRAVDAGGAASPHLSVVGALRVGSEAEATALPELRAQAAGVAARLTTGLATTR